MTMKGNQINTDFGSGLQVGDFFFLSAVDTCGADGTYPCRDSRECVLFCMRKFQEILYAAGGSLDSLVQLRFYFSDSEHLTAAFVREVLSELIEEPLPAFSVIPAGAVPGNLMADGIAVIMSNSVSCGSCGGCAKSC